MLKNLRSFILPSLLACLLFTACGPASQKTPTIDANMIITEAAQTVAAQLTLNPPAPATPAPTNPPLPTETSAAAPAGPTATAGQAAPPPAATAAAPAAPTTAPAASQDAAAFVADITIPDGTPATPGAQFPKTWRIKNTGATTWTTTYSLVPIDGDRMGSPDSIPMPSVVRPGDTVDITVNLTAPTKEGTYQTFFRLRNASGQFFRLDGTGDLWVKINVGGLTPTPNLTQTAGAPTITPTVTPTR